MSNRLPSPSFCRRIRQQWRIKHPSPRYVLQPDLPHIFSWNRLAERLGENDAVPIGPPPQPEPVVQAYEDKRFRELLELDDVYPRREPVSLSVCNPLPQRLSLLHERLNSHHEHVLKLVGFMKQSGGVLVVTEYYAATTLYELLHVKHTTFDFPTQLRVALETARGMLFLHRRHIFHGDLNTRCLLFDQSEGVKISGLLEERSHAGYTNREWDLFSYGVLLMEILTGQIPSTVAAASTPGLHPSTRASIMSHIYGHILFSPPESLLAEIAIDCLMTPEELTFHDVVPRLSQL